MNPETRKLINWWMIEAKKQTDPFIKFFILYMCLDAWMTAGSLSDRDTDKIRWLTQTENTLKIYWGTAPRKGTSLNGLKVIGQVEDMRPNHRGEFVFLNDDDFESVIKFLYQIRCNLFHGGKSPVNSNDKRLVSLASKLLENWLDWTLAKTRYSTMLEQGSEQQA